MDFAEACSRMCGNIPYNLLVSSFSPGLHIGLVMALFLLTSCRLGPVARSGSSLFLPELLPAHSATDSNGNVLWQFAAKMHFVSGCGEHFISARTWLLCCWQEFFS